MRHYHDENINAVGGHERTLNYTWPYAFKMVMHTKKHIYENKL